MNMDIVNGSFELIGALVLMLNVKALYKDKKVQGIHWGSTLFFSLWGIWNLIYYPSLDQWFSFAGGLAIVTVNTTWLIQVIYYSRRR